MTMAVTGHRPDRLGGYDDDTFNRLVQYAAYCFEKLKPPDVITGMALGWDQAVAQACVDLKIPFVAAPPFKDQACKWSPSAQRRWHFLLERAKEVHVVCEGGYAAWKMQKRNEWMVDHAHCLLALWDGQPYGGTHKCVQYARKKKLLIYSAWPRWARNDF